MTESIAGRPRFIIECIYYVAAIFFFLYLFVYLWTSEGGPTLLAMTLVPVTYVLFVLNGLRENDLYPGLPHAANYVIAALYIVLALAVAVYMHTEYYDIGTVPAGVWSPTDLVVVGPSCSSLVMEYTRKDHFPLFILNLVLILYAVYGWVVPGMFGHPGLELGADLDLDGCGDGGRGFSPASPQLALTLIGSFLLVLSVLRAFGCVESIVSTAARLANKSAHALPQAAVLGSMGVATVSGSGAANAITIGSATIPAMIAAGIPRVNAAAIETAASL